MERLLRHYMNRFYGYGDWAAPYWFIGIEEKDCGEPIEERLARWEARECSDLEDFAEFHAGTSHCQFTGAKAKYQGTWGPVSKLFLSFKGVDWNLDDVLEFQGKKFARRNQETAALDLFPLPAVTSGTWPYQGRFPNVSCTRSRILYTHTVYARRARKLRQQIKRFRPRFVTFYSVGNLQLNEGVADTELKRSSCKRCYEAERDGTFYFVCPIWRASDGELRTFGKYLRQKISLTDNN